MYDDESSLYIDYKDACEGAGRLQLDMAAIEEFADKWLVNFNPGKTESIFTHKRSSDAPLIQMQETDIMGVQQHKHLGIN